MADEITPQRSSITKQPQAQPSPTYEPTTTSFDEWQGGGDGAVHLPTLSSIKQKLTTREGWLGDFDYGFLCMPQLPFAFRGTARVKSTPFYALNDDLPILIAMIVGFQHSLAMLAGVITPPLIFGNSLGFSGDVINYMVAASLIASGILSAVQMTRFCIPFTRGKYYFGTGLITVVGTSFATLSTAEAIFNALYTDGTCTSSIVDGLEVRNACPAAWGYLLGTSCVTALLEMLLAFVPPAKLKRIFPPIITGLVVLLIGLSLIGDSGFPNWAGGSGSCEARPPNGTYSVCPQEGSPHALPWGSAQYLGLGFLSFVTIILVELFGSPFMKNASIVLGLIVGMIVAGPAGYVDGTSIREAPVITFLWVHTFPLRVYGPAVLPMLAVYISLAMEATGDITASSEASLQPVDGPLYDSRVQGGILADGFNGLLSALFTNAPMSIFAQNNGVIALTRCANRGAGYWCASFLILYGVLAKISGVFLAIPNPVLGGVTTFLFASVAASGLRVIGLCKFSRRDRFILSAAGGIGFGNLLLPKWSAYLFGATVSQTNRALAGFENSIIIILSTPFLSGGIVGIILNLILPYEPEQMIESEKQAELMSTIERRREVEELGDDLVQTKSAEKTH